MVNATKNSKQDELDRLMSALEQRVNKLRIDLRGAEKELQAVVTTIELLNRGKVDTEAEANDYLREFKGLTHIEALVKFAKDNGNNRFRMSEAKRLLVAAGLIKSKKNASNIIFNDIQRSELFRRVAPGEYELMDSTEPTGMKITQIA
jgi:hypothetical protein